MAYSVPLQLETVDAVIYRLDPVATRGVKPPGAIPQGYDDVFRETAVYDTDAGASVATRQSTRRELPEVRVPCQVETSLYGEQQMTFSGNTPQTRIGLVFYRPTLKLLNLIDADTGNVLLAVGDRVARLERPGLGTSVLQFPDDGFFINEIVPRSWGFGADGYDLHVAYLVPRDQGSAT